MARHASPVQSLLVDDRFDGDVYAHMGAGDVTAIAPQLVDELGR